MRLPVFGRSDLFIHVGSTKVQSIPDPNRQGEEQSRFWKLFRVSLESVDGKHCSPGLGVAIPCEPGYPEPTKKADKKEKSSDKETDTPTPQKPEDVVTPVSPTEVMPTEKVDTRTPEAAAKAEAAVAAYEAEERDYLNSHINEDDTYEPEYDPTLDMIGVACMGFM
ncbi:hypothetical protein [Synechococcus sp. WH 8016]|uniref:hypothetical protein n=1 Tax=Synechococcus sp. WH 8016 TaxID=166318 RepID=UPI00022DA15A|nr:hypothetical protein [Synechococcus sp. WH 8016]EHA63738.1 hypothetical protein Syn8016DRAFT_0779 [Synechococcus sp. WH 8016]